MKPAAQLCPSWATSMVSNHRAAFVAKHKIPCKLTDDEIYGCIKFIGTLEDAESTDNAILGLMTGMCDIN